jgi:hypothetical protein
MLRTKSIQRGMNRFRVLAGEIIRRAGFLGDANIFNRTTEKPTPRTARANLDGAKSCRAAVPVRWTLEIQGRGIAPRT